MPDHPGDPAQQAVEVGDQPQDGAVAGGRLGRAVGEVAQARARGAHLRAGRGERGLAIRRLGAEAGGQGGGGAPERPAGVPHRPGRPQEDAGGRGERPADERAGQARVEGAIRRGDAGGEHREQDHRVRAGHEVAAEHGRVGHDEGHGADRPPGPPQLLSDTAVPSDTSASATATVTANASSRLRIGPP